MEQRHVAWGAVFTLPQRHARIVQNDAPVRIDAQPSILEIEFYRSAEILGKNMDLLLRMVPHRHRHRHRRGHIRNASG